MDDITTIKLKGFGIKLKVRPGVFSSKGIDEGSKLLIETMEIKNEQATANRNGTVIADLACGNGVIGLVAARLNLDGHVHLLDDHLRSVTIAQENKELNRAKNVEVFLSDLFSAVGTRTYQQILSNPPQQLGNEFLEELITESFNHLKSNGELVMVVKSNLREVFKRFLNQIFGNHEIIAQSKGHVVLKARKKS